MSGGSTYQIRANLRTDLRSLAQCVFSVTFVVAPDTDYDYEVVYATIGNPAFYLALYLTSVYIFEASYSMLWSRGWAKNQALTNQNSRNSWCQTVTEGIICYVHGVRDQLSGISLRRKHVTYQKLANLCRKRILESINK